MKKLITAVLLLATPAFAEISVDGVYSAITLQYRTPSYGVGLGMELASPNDVTASVTRFIGIRDHLEFGAAFGVGMGTDAAHEISVKSHPHLRYRLNNVLSAIGGINVSYKTTSQSIAVHPTIGLGWTIQE